MGGWDMSFGLGREWGGWDVSGGLGGFGGNRFSS